MVYKTKQGALGDDQVSGSVHNPRQRRRCHQDLRTRLRQLLAPGSAAGEVNQGMQRRSARRRSIDTPQVTDDQVRLSSHVPPGSSHKLRTPARAAAKSSCHTRSCNPQLGVLDADQVLHAASAKSLTCLVKQLVQLLLLSARQPLLTVGTADPDASPGAPSFRAVPAQYGTCAALGKALLCCVLPRLEA